MIVHKKSGIEEIAKIINQLFQLPSIRIYFPLQLAGGRLIINAVIVLLHFYLGISKIFPISGSLWGGPDPYSSAKVTVPLPKFFMCLL